MLFTGNKKELYQFLNNFDFDSIRTTPLSDIVFKVNFRQDDDKKTEFTDYIKFSPYEDVWFESPCEIRQFNLNQSDLKQYIKEDYGDCTELIMKYEQTLQRGNFHYNIDFPQVFPFMAEDNITILEAISEEKLIDINF